MAFDKRGQEGLTLTTLLLIVLGIVVVVVVIIGFTTGFDFIFGKVETLPGQSLQAAVTACELAADQALVADYCNTFRKVEINGKEAYVTCKWLGGKNYLQKTLNPTDGTCTTANNEQAYCVAQDLKEGTMVDDYPCVKASS